MTTHYILADDYDRWNPGEPIEDVEAPLSFLVTEWKASPSSYRFETWLEKQIEWGNIMTVESDSEAYFECATCGYNTFDRDDAELHPLDHPEHYMEEV